MNLHESEMAPGYTGALWDDTPLLTHANVRPFVWAILLYRGAVRPSEVIGAVTQVCGLDDLREGAWDPLLGDYGDRSRVELLVDEVLGEMISEGLCRYNSEEDLWVLSLGGNKRNVPHVINAVTALDAMMPQHLLADLAQEDRDRLPVPF